MKYLVLLCDGMADEKIEALNFRSPMEAAHKPCMDYLAARSLVGTVNNIPEGMKPESDVANLSVLSYDPAKYAIPRGPLEALAMGLPLSGHTTALRCSLVTLSDEDGIAYTDRTLLDHSADEISDEEADALIGALQDALGNDARHFYAGVSYRNSLLWEDAPAAVEITAPHDLLGQVIGEYLPTDPEGDGYAYFELMQASYEILNHHPINEARREKGLRPANSIWLWAAGKNPSLPSFPDKWDVKASVISAVDLIKGIGIAAGMKAVDVEGATGNFHTHYRAKGDAAIAQFKDGQDYVCIHVEAPDECGHRGEVENKVACIEKIDEEILKPVYEYLIKCKQDFKILVLPDHPTSVMTRTHTADAVPFFLYCSADEVAGVKNFCEESAQATNLHIPKGQQLTDLLTSDHSQKSLAAEAGTSVKKRHSTSFLLDWIELVGVALVTVLLLMTVAFRHSPVIGSSMYPTLIGSPSGGSETQYTKLKGYDILLISDLFYTPDGGDIVIIQHPQYTDQPLVKRIIATEGQHIKIDFANWKIWVDGKLLDEDYINRIAGAQMNTYDIDTVFHTPVEDGIWEGTVPEGQIFVLGDNRNNSKDSRSLGYIDTRWIVGRVVIRLSPLNRFGKID